MAKSLDAAMDNRLSWEAKGLMFEIEFYPEATRRKLAGAADRLVPELETALVELFTYGYVSSEWLWLTTEEKMAVR